MAERMSKIPDTMEDEESSMKVKTDSQKLVSFSNEDKNKESDESQSTEELELHDYYHSASEDDWESQLASEEAETPGQLKRCLSQESLKLMKKSKDDYEMHLKEENSWESGRLQHKLEPNRGRLSDMERIIFWDMDNYAKNVPLLLSMLPKTCFVWICHGGQRDWVEPDYSLKYRMAVAERLLYLDKNCGPEKNASDFMISYWIGKLDAELPKRVTFVIMSGDMGFDPIVRKFETDERQLRLVDPHLRTEQNLVLQLLYSDITSMKFVCSKKVVECSVTRLARDFLIWLRKKISRTAINVENAEDVKYLKESEEPSFIGFFKDQSSYSAQAFIKIASDSDEFLFAITSSNPLFLDFNVSEDMVISLRQSDESYGELKGEINNRTITDFIETHRIPQKSCKRVFTCEMMDHLLVFVNSESKDFLSVINMINSLSLEYHKKVIFVDSGDESSARVWEFLEVKVEDCPAIRYITLGDMTRYQPQSMDLSASAIQHFIQDVQDGKVKGTGMDTDEQKQKDQI